VTKIAGSGAIRQRHVSVAQKGQRVSNRKMEVFIALYAKLRFTDFSRDINYHRRRSTFLLSSVQDP
jgi:hypothetical protein